MRIILIGQAAFAEQILAGLIERGHTIAAVYCPPDSRAGHVDPLKAAAISRGLPVRQHRSLKHPAVAEEMRALRADLAVLAYVTQIVAPEVLAAPRLGSICFHPSLLPRYRGGSAINWQLIRGETRSGVTVFWPDAGIDTGPILLQKETELGPDDTAGSAYYQKLFPLGVEAVLEAVDLVAAGKAPRVPQDESQASYDPLCRDEHARIVWERPACEVHNLIRGCDPQPGAHTSFSGHRLRLYGSRLVAAARGARPGEVVSLSDEGLVVATADGAVRCTRARLDEGPKVAVAEAAALAGITAGARLA